MSAPIRGGRAYFQIMVEHRIRSIIVLDGAQKLVGIIAREDVIAGAQGDRARLKMNSFLLLLLCGRYAFEFLRVHHAGLSR